VYDVIGRTGSRARAPAKARWEMWAAVSRAKPEKEFEQGLGHV